MPADRPLRVILEDRCLRGVWTGVGNYVVQLLAHLPLVSRELKVEPFGFAYNRRSRLRDDAGPTSSQAASSVAVPSAGGGARAPWWVRRTLQGLYGQAFRLLTRGYDVYHEPNHIPLPSPVPTVTTIHDISVITHPPWHPDDRIRWYERDFQRGLRQSRRIIAASHFTKRELVERCGVEVERIDVTYQAPRAAFRPVDAQRRREVLRRLDLPERFFLYAGTLEPRKNVEGLLDAYERLPRSTRRSHPLVLVGGWGWKSEQIRERLAHFETPEEVRLIGYQRDPVLAALYASCTALVWPTFYEGFGLPPLEAMACGAPVVVSNVASLPEVVGDAAVLIDPHDGPAWTDAMRGMCENQAFRSGLAAKGPPRAAEFSWMRCAEQTLACYWRALRTEERF